MQDKNVNTTTIVDRQNESFLSNEITIVDNSTKSIMQTTVIETKMMNDWT